MKAGELNVIFAWWSRVLGIGVSVLFWAMTARAAPPQQSEFGPEILHVPFLERRADQGILRPVPISVELPRDVGLRARRVLVHYRVWGDPDWSTLELRRAGTRFEGAIPCLEISTISGDLRYHIRVHDEKGRVIAAGASRAMPYRITIRHDTTLGSDSRRAAKCPDPEDCPVGLPGCPSPPVNQLPCQTDHDCVGGMTCGWRGFCERATRSKNWLSISVQQDIGVVSTTGACHVHSQEDEGYACYRSDGVQYAGNPVLTNEPLGAGAGPTRIVLGYDRLVHYDTSVGIRVGWALAGQGPTPRGGTEFMPLSVSVRATHWFGADLFARSGLRPFALLTAGYAMVDIPTKVHVREDPSLEPYQGGNDLEQTLKVWKRAGDVVVGAGGGLSFAFTTWASVSVEVLVQEAFPIGALVFSPGASLAVGF